MTEAVVRSVPPAPGSVSEQAQQYLASPRQFDKSAEPSDPTDYEAWVFCRTPSGCIAKC